MPDINVCHDLYNSCGLYHMIDIKGSLTILVLATRGGGHTGLWGLTMTVKAKTELFGISEHCDLLCEECLE